MKKVLLTLAAVATLAACSKSEVQYEPANEIAITPVQQNITKTMLTGTDFPTTLNFNVWAWYKQMEPGTTLTDWMSNTSDNQLYIPEKPFVYREDKNWGGQTSYYWPKLGSLLFAGYYPAEIATSVEYTLDDSVNKMVFTDIEQSQVAASGYTEDIMYFNITNTSYASGPVPVVFKHALSWITVNVNKTAGSPKIVIDEIMFTDVNPKGTGTVNGTEVISWETTGTAEETVIAKNVELKDAVQQLSHEPLIIPQAMAGNLVITYTVYSSDTEKFTEVYTSALNSLKTDLNTWEPAKHYIYNISIGTEEILIAPVIKDWEDVKIPVSVE